MLPAMRLRTGVLLVAAILALASCGSSARPGSRAPKRATLILDFNPNAIHTGIYAALARRYDLKAGVRLHVIAPASSTDALKFLETGRADFAVLDIHDLAIARERGENLVGIMAVVERPLAAVIAAPGIGSPRQLAGRTVGVTGAPSDYAVLNSIVAGAGGDPRRLHDITIGFNAVPALLAGRVAGATAFWNDEGVAVTRARPGFHVFQAYNYGAPAYPELVLCATGSTLRRHPALAAAVVKAVVRGYEFTLAHPKAAAADIDRLAPSVDPKLVAEELPGELAAFKGAGGRVGALDPHVLRAWAAWEARFGIVKRPPDVARMFDSRLVAAANG
ncbi:MAG: putative hydroxymethylpyrimidine transport system substrate-binding protein [Solirubrobacteraceae bacterium]|nr:putative hydroxymethylpyrimidine transport system substrate-binding protein [Solirubrobacteraceae bacterium]